MAVGADLEGQTLGAQGRVLRFAVALAGTQYSSRQNDAGKGAGRVEVGPGRIDVVANKVAACGSQPDASLSCLRSGRASAGAAIAAWAAPTECRGFLGEEMVAAWAACVLGRTTV